MGLIVQIIVGLLIALIFIYAGRTTNREKDLFGYALLLGAFWYVAFGALSGMTAGALLPQIIGTMIFAIIAILGLRYSITIIGLGWLLHIAWDWGSPFFSDVSAAPSWTAATCIGFDIPAGIYLLLRSRGRIPLTAKTQQVT